MEDLAKLEYAKSLILMDPRTSSPGFGFLLWTIKLYGDDFVSYWKRIAPSILTIADSWDAGYGLFTSGEAPLVLSYTTSPAYHMEYEKTDRYKAIIFKEGNYMQIEGAGIVKGAKHKDAAGKFIDFLLSEEVQKTIPLTNWMFPVIQDVPLPASFAVALKPDVSLLINYEAIKQNQELWIKSWTEMMSKTR